MARTDALLGLLRYLQRRGYRFTTVTPATHARVLARKPEEAPSLRDVFGWNRPFRAEEMDAELMALLGEADVLERDGGRLRSRLRVASLDECLFLHSAYPTKEEDAVFFGPDTYRFASFIRRHWRQLDPKSVVDMGAGSGAGGIVAGRLSTRAGVKLVDSNRAALELAAVNATAAGVSVELEERSDIPPGADLIIANPPYMMDDANRSYRDGGDLRGGEVSLQWASEALGRLEPGGTMLLYTGAAFVEGESPLLSALQRTCRDAGAELTIEEIDPDVFGEELEKPAYAEVERIAAIGAVLRVPR